MPVGHLTLEQRFAYPQPALEGGPEGAVERGYIHKRHGQRRKWNERKRTGMERIYCGDFPSIAGRIQVEFHI